MLYQVVNNHLKEPKNVGKSCVSGYIEGRTELDAFLDDFNRAGTTTFSIRSSKERPSSKSPTNSEQKWQDKLTGSPSRYGNKGIYYKKDIFS